MASLSSIRKNVEEQLRDTKIRTYSMLIFTFAVVTIFIVFAIQPSIVAISSDYEQLQQLQVEDAKLSANIENLNTIINIYNTSVVGSNLTLLNTSLPDLQERGPIFANMTAIAKADNVTLGSVAFTSDTASGSSNPTIIRLPNTLTHKLGFTISATGKYADLQKLVKDYEEYPRVFYISTVSLAPSNAKDGGSGVINAGITGYIFYFTSMAK